MHTFLHDAIVVVVAIVVICLFVVLCVPDE